MNKEYMIVKGNMERKQESLLPPTGDNWELSQIGFAGSGYIAVWSRIDPDELARIAAEEEALYAEIEASAAKNAVGG